MFVDFSRIRRCTEEDRIKAIEPIQLMVNLGDVVRRKGLLFLENDRTLREPFLNKAIELVVGGTDPVNVREIMLAYLNASDLSDLEYLIRVIYIQGALLIQEGANPEVLKAQLSAYLGEGFMSRADEILKTAHEINYDLKAYLKEEVDITGTPELDRKLRKVDDRSIQRILRECDLSIVAIACEGASGEMRRMLLYNLAHIHWEPYFEGRDIVYDSVGEITTEMIRQAQKRILEIADDLVRQGEIVIFINDDMDK